MSNASDILSETVNIVLEMPLNWTKRKLVELCIPKQWRTISQDEMSKSGYPVFGANKFIGYYPKYNHENETIAITCRGATCGTVNLVPAKTYITGNSMCLDNVSRDIDVKYLYYASSYRTLSDVISGSAQPQITGESLRLVFLPIPPLPEQKKIASILTSVDEVIENTQKQIDKLQDLKKATMNELLTKGIGHTEFKDSELGRIPKSWGVGNLSNLISIKHGFAFEGQFFSNQPNGTILLTPGNFHRDGELYFGEKTKYFTGEIPNEYILENGDLLVVMTDLTSEMTILGNTIILSSSDTVLHNQRIGRIKFSDQVFDLNFLMLLMNSFYVKKYVRSTATGTTVRHTSPSKIMEQNVPIPAISEQIKIARVILTIQKTIEKKQKKLAQTQFLKRSLMQDLLTGKVRVKVN